MADVGTGALSAAELKGMFEANAVPISDAEVADLLGEMDTNRDGAIDLEEFLAYVNRLHILHEVSEPHHHHSMGSTTNGSEEAISLGMIPKPLRVASFQVDFLVPVTVGGHQATA